MRRFLRKKWIWALSAIALTLLASLLVFNSGRITKANCDRIRPGMSVPETIEILGEPDPQIAGMDGLDPQIHGSLRFYWVDRERGGAILVEFDRDYSQATEIDLIEFDLGGPNPFPRPGPVLRSQFIQALSLKELFSRRWEDIVDKLHGR